MNNSIGKAMLCEENIDFIAETIDELCCLCEIRNISLNSEYVRDCIDNILVFYEHYLQTLKSKFLRYRLLQNCFLVCCFYGNKDV